MVVVEAEWTPDKIPARVQRRKPALGGEKISSSQNLSHIFNQASHIKNARMNLMRRRKRDFLTRINYTNTFTVAVLPALALVYVFFYAKSLLPENSATFKFSFIYYHVMLLAFSAGYHKCFAHNTYRVKYGVLLWYFAIFGAGIGLGSIRWWATLHRAHHQYTDDTERDPYLIKRGFAWAHYGWLIRKPKIVQFYEDFVQHEFPDEQSVIQNEIDDNNEDDFFDEIDSEKRAYQEQMRLVVLQQERLYLVFWFISTIVIPVLVTVTICNDTVINGLLYPGILRMFISQQPILLTQSVCHLKHIQATIPTQPFNDKNSSQNCNNPLMAFLTYGNAAQNYHHEFPHDYRSQSSHLAYDPTKWFIWILSKIGMVDELCKTPKDLITQLQIQQQQRVINRMKSQLNWGTPISKLPLITPKQFKDILASASHSGRIYIIIQKVIHDITPFMNQHPGGIQLLKASHGLDATKAFYGGVYGHLTAAVNLLATMRIGLLDDGNDEDVWRRVAKEQREVNDDHQSKLYKSAEAA